MGILDLIRHVPSMKAEAVRRLYEGKGPDDFNLIDVRQPSEYEEEHLPGAALIPLSKLASRLDEIDKDKPTVVY